MEPNPYEALLRGQPPSKHPPQTGSPQVLASFFVTLILAISLFAAAALAVVIWSWLTYPLF
jgi:fatty acid desaturase